MNDIEANPLLQPWDAPFGLPPFERLRPAHFAPALEEAMRRHLAELDAIAAQPAAPTFANTVAAFDASGRDLARVGGGLRQPHQIRDLSRRCRPSSARWRRGSRRTEARCTCTRGSSRRIDALHGRRDELGLAPEERAAPRARAPRLRARGRAALGRGPGAPRADRRAPGGAHDARSARTCSPTRRTTGWRCATSATSRGCRSGCARRSRGGGARARRGATRAWSRCRARSSCRSSPSPAGATCASRRSRPGCGAASNDGRARQPARRARDPGAAQRAGAAARLRELRRLRARGPHGGHARGGRAAPAAGVGAGQGQGRRGMPTRSPRWPARSGETHAIEPWDWRYYAEKVRAAALRLRRRAAQALLLARPHARRGVRHRAAPLRDRLRRAPRHPRLPSRRARLRGARARRRGPWASSSATTSRAPRSAAAPG